MQIEEIVGATGDCHGKDCAPSQLLEGIHLEKEAKASSKALIGNSIFRMQICGDDSSALFAVVSVFCDSIIAGYAHPRLYLFTLLGHEGESITANPRYPVPMNTVHLASFVDSIRLTLHVLGATIWVGGQFTLAGLVPMLRKSHPEALTSLAKAFNKIAWPAYALLLITGAWNMTTLPKSVPSNYSLFLSVKMSVATFSGIAAFIHMKAKTPKSIALWGSLSGLAALSATYFGVLIAG